MKPALLYERLADNKIKCQLCPHNCLVDDGQSGICRVRKNLGGDFFSLNFHKVAATHMDPIEKKPLYHFLPSSPSFSMATMGCNLSCRFCQNNSLSMVINEHHLFGKEIAPEQLVDMALKEKASSISYTYSEPTIYFELMLETAKIAKDKGLKNVMVSNGFMSEKALELIAPYMDAANIDLKAYSDEFYRKFCGARLQPVLETIKNMHKMKIWIEVTTLLIPGLNTDKDQLKELISFILEVDAHIPWHVSRFFPQHKMKDMPITATDTIYLALEKGKEMGLKHLYGGNMAPDQWSDTYCTRCQSVLVERSGYTTVIKDLSGGKCGQCQTPIAGVWE